MNALKERPTTSFQHLDVAFNTGRAYTQHGQRIAIWTLEASNGLKCLVMRDFDRDITYCFDHRDFELESDLIRYVMYAYDHFVCRCSDFEIQALARDLVRSHNVNSLRFRTVSL